MADAVDVLFELGTEELPPLALRRLGDALLAGFRAGLDRERVGYAGAEGFVTPRRLAVRVNQCQVCQPEIESERLGPLVGAALDGSGLPTTAATGFARSCGVPVEALGRSATDKGERLAYRWREPGKATVDLLPGIAAQALQGLPIPKRMRWGDSSVQFVRPVHWLVFLMGEEVVPCELLGVEADRLSRGHRFHAPGTLTVRHPADYPRQLRDEGFVIADFEQRRGTIRSQVNALAVEAGGQAEVGDTLLDEVTGLTEWPVAIQCEFDPAFLGVPVELLVLTMTQDQRYFPVCDSGGVLTNRFIAVANIESTNPEVVRQGNERVIRPRFADAKFFWDRDRVRPLSDHLEELKSVVFHERLGSMYDKSARVAALACDIALLTGADTDQARRAGWLSRCDLMTGTVLEFPEMQGIAGRHLLTHERQDAELAQAMEDFYLPRHASDRLPETPIGAVVSLADRLDTLTGIFNVGEGPTGDKDPYGLRRAALGALRILKERQLRVPLRAVIQIANNRLGEALRRANTVDAVHQFMLERLKGIYREQGVDPSVFAAVQATHPTTVADFDRRVAAIAVFRALPEARALAEADKRARNILRKAGFGGAQTEFDPERLADPAETWLGNQILALDQQLDPLLEASDYTTALRLLAGLRDPLDRFFTEVMVMVDDPVLRANRLTLLSRLSQLFLRVADISRLQISTRQGGEQ